MTKRAVAVRHVGFEDLGLLETILTEQGVEIAYLDAWWDDLAPAEDADLVVLLGGPISVNDTAAYPFLTGEIALAERCLAAGRPLLGICLGAQIIAKAVGGTVAPGPAKEIGWAPLSLTEAGRASPLRHLEGVAVLHWHGEQCRVPQPALAATDACATQAFAVGPTCLALQFHAEAGTSGLESWFVGHTLEIETTPGIDVPGLRAATARHGPAMVRAGRALFAAWLDGAGL